MRMMRSWMVPLVLIATVSAEAKAQAQAAGASPRTPAETAIRQAMVASAAGWNAGDLSRFMTVYADDAVFVTPKGLLRGKEAISAKYRPSFRGTGSVAGNARGRLSFAFLDMRGIDPRHAMLFARWTLTGPSSVETGMTTLVFERRGSGWRIIADHSS